MSGILAIYALPYLLSFLRGEKVYFPWIYYTGIILTLLALFRFDKEVVNNWVFTLSLLAFLPNLIMIFIYIFS